MKKFFAIAAMAAMLIACGEKEPEENPGNGNGNGNGGGETEYVNPITIDGDFSDWDALDASKVAVAELPAAPVKYDALTLVKVYADEMYLHVYFEFDDVVVADRGWVPFHCYINTDNDTTTGGGDDDHEPYCSDWMLETSIFSEGEFVSYDPAVFPWGGEPGASGWEWSIDLGGAEAGAENNWGAYLGEGSGVGSGAGNGNAYEFSIIREMIPGPWADTFTIGFDIQQSWSSAGVLPLATSTDENPNGVCPQLVVTIDK